MSFLDSAKGVAKSVAKRLPPVWVADTVKDLYQGNRNVIPGTQSYPGPTGGTNLAPAPYSAVGMLGGATLGASTTNTPPPPAAPTAPPSGGGRAAAGGPTGSSPQVAALRADIIARRERANSIFDALTGAVQALAQEKRGGIEGDFAREQGRAIEDSTNQLNTVARTYRGRGLGDSSYKVNALDEGATAQARALEDLGRQRESGLTQVGSEAETALARINADRGSVGGIDLAQVGRREDGTYDVNQLAELRNSLDERIREAEVQQTQFGTQAGFRGKLEKIAPYGGTVDTLKSALSSLVQSAAPKVVKDRLASAIISNYAPTDAQTWTNFYEEQSRRQPVAG